MARLRESDVLRPSLIDRLTVDGRSDARIGIQELRDAIRRDLEWLLNARRLLEVAAEDYAEASRSILAFGLPDLSPYSRANGGDRDRICTLIADAIRTFEPRLAKNSIQVEHVPSDEVDDFDLRFRISAVIHVDPVREAISFDTSMDFNNGMVVVQDSTDA